MTCKILSMPLGALETNSYLLSDVEEKQAVIIDPAEGCLALLKKARELGCEVTEIWLTHAHFDHLTGIPELSSQLAIPIRLNQWDIPLYQARGGASLFGFQVPALPDPLADLTDQMQLSVGKSNITVLHTPGHSAGHVVFYAEQEKAILCGDVIFLHGIGRTDLPGGDFQTLLHSIKQKLFTLPAETRLLPGHGPETTIEEEMNENPYL